MKRRNNYMLGAVAFFIIITIIIFTASLAFGFEFIEINKIIVAVSIASYFLSFAEMEECNLDLQYNKYIYAKEKYDLLLSEERSFFQDLEKRIFYIEKVYTNNADKISQDTFNSLELLKNDVSKVKQDDIDLIQREKQLYINRAKRSDKICFWMKTLGFLSLICVLAFEYFFKIVETQNNILCLFAFLFVICTMVNKSSNTQKLEEHKNAIDDYTAAIKKSIENSRHIMEDIDNGQVEDED